MDSDFLFYMYQKLKDFGQLISNRFLVTSKEQREYVYLLIFSALHENDVLFLSSLPGSL